MKNVQIPYELFVSLLRYHLMEDDDCLNEIRQGLEQKLDSLVRRAPALQATVDAQNAEGALPAGGAQ